MQSNWQIGLGLATFITSSQAYRLIKCCKVKGTMGVKEIQKILWDNLEFCVLAEEGTHCNCLFCFIHIYKAFQHFSGGIPIV